MQQLRFILRNGFSLHVSGDNLTHHQDVDIFRGESFLSASFVIPSGRIRLIQLPLGVLVLVSQFRLLGVDEFNICGSEHHAWPYTAYVLLMMGEIVARNM